MVPAQEEIFFVDQRDKQSYAIFKIGDAIWMEQNFNYITKNSWIYDNKKENEKKYGPLYTWEAAREACTDGWHLPTDEEWKILEKMIGIPDPLLDETDYRSPEYIQKLDQFKKVFNLVYSGCRKHDTGRFLGKIRLSFSGP